MVKSRQQSKVNVPECQYGKACTRKDCIYRHPPAPAKLRSAVPISTNAALPAEEDTTTICMAYVGGTCSFGRYCTNHHPTDEECEKIVAKLRSSACRFGNHCRTKGCLYKHPSAADNLPAAPAAAPQLTVWADKTMLYKPAAAYDISARCETQQPTSTTASIPTAIARSIQLRDPEAFKVVDFLDRFVAVNRHNSGIDSARVLDLHLQTPSTVSRLLDTVLLHATLEHAVHGVWVVTCSTNTNSCASNSLPKGIVYDDVEAYLKKHKYKFRYGVDDGEAKAGAFLVFPPRVASPETIRAILLCGRSGTSKTAFAHGLVAQGMGRVLMVSQAEFFYGAQYAQAAWIHIVQMKGLTCSFWDWFDAEDMFLGVALQHDALTFVEKRGIKLPCNAAGNTDTYVGVTLAFMPSPLEVTRYLGRVFHVEYIYYLQLNDAGSGRSAEEKKLSCLIVRLTAEKKGGDKSCEDSVPFYAHCVLSAPQSDAKRALLNLNSVKWGQIIVDAGTRITSSLIISKVVDLRSAEGGTVSCRALGCLFSKATYAPFPVAVDPDVVSEPTINEAITNSLVEIRVTGEKPTTPISVRVIAGQDFPEVVAYMTDSAETVARRLCQGYACVYRGQTFLPPRASRCARRLCVLDSDNCTAEERLYWVNAAGLRPHEVDVVYFETSEQPGAEAWEFSKPTEAEGWAQITVISGAHAMDSSIGANKTVIAQWCPQLTKETIGCWTTKVTEAAEEIAASLQVSCDKYLPHRLLDD